MRTDTSKTALMKATDLLARQEHSERRLKQKLAARQYSADEIDDAVDKLKQHNYLDDEQTAARQFEHFYNEGRMSVRQICVKLIKRGFDASLVESLVPRDTFDHDVAAAIRALKIKFKALPDDIKMWQFLSMRGFDSDVASAAVDEFKRNIDAD